MHRGWTGQGDGRYVFGSRAKGQVLGCRRSYRLGETRVHGGCDHQYEKASITSRDPTVLVDEWIGGSDGTKKPGTNKEQYSNIVTTIWHRL